MEINVFPKSKKNKNQGIKIIFETKNNNLLNIISGFLFLMTPW